VLQRTTAEFDAFPIQAFSDPAIPALAQADQMLHL